MRYFWAVAVILFISLSIYSCSEGLSPGPEPQVQQEGFGGKIFFNGEWHSNVTRTHLIVFKNPLYSPDDFSLSNIAYVSLAIPHGVPEFSYSTLDSAFYPQNSKLAAGTYSFIAVAQQTTPQLTLNGADWIIAGIYFAPGNDTIPGVVSVPEDGFISDVNINCFFP